VPSDVPTELPTLSPTETPSANPTEVPTHLPTMLPTDEPSVAPSDVPSAMPSFPPTEIPTAVPSDAPSTTPTTAPSDLPSINPTEVPSSIPSIAPSALPTVIPSLAPSERPVTRRPTSRPTFVPTTPGNGEFSNGRRSNSLTSGQSTIIGVVVALATLIGFSIFLYCYWQYRIKESENILAAWEDRASVSSDVNVLKRISTVPIDKDTSKDVPAEPFIYDDVHIGIDSPNRENRTESDNPMRTSGSFASPARTPTSSRKRTVRYKF